MTSPTDLSAEVASAKRIIDECAKDDISDSNEHKVHLAPQNRQTWKRIQHAWSHLTQEEQETYAAYIDVSYNRFHQRGDQLLTAVEKLADRVPPPTVVSRDVALGSEELRAFEQAFSIEYVDDRSQRVERFAKYVDAIVTKWSDNKFHSPYSAIVQSSGTGKSRLIREYARSSYVMYFCLRAVNTGYPLQTPIRDELVPSQPLEDADYSKRCLSYLVACIKTFVDEYAASHTPEQWFDAHALDEAQRKTIWSNIKSRVASIGSETTQSLKEMLVVSCQKLTSPAGGRKARFVFAFDEAGWLLARKNGHSNLFRLLRWALRSIPRNSGVCAVMLDTMSSASDFVPTQRDDPSDRVVTQQLSLFAPFYLLDTFDLYTDALATLTIPDLEQADHLLRFGRPLWYTVVKDDHRADIDGLLKLAKKKLLCASPDPLPDKLTDAQALSLGCVRYCFDVTPTSQLASDLIASHMRVCVYINEHRDYLYNFSPSEPVLVEAATQLLYEETQRGDKLMMVMLKHLYEHLRFGLVDGGPRGEFIARIVLLMAADSVRLRARADSEWDPATPFHFARGIKVGDFLQELAGVGAGLFRQTDAAMVARFLDGDMFLTHFLPVMDYTPSRSELHEFMKRGAGVCCRTGQKGVDLIIPVLLRRSSSSSSQLDEMDVDSDSKGETGHEQRLDNVRGMFKRVSSSTAACSTAKAVKCSSDDDDKDQDMAGATSVGSSSGIRADTGQQSTGEAEVSFILVQVRNYVKTYDAAYRGWRVHMRPECMGMMESAPDFPYLAVYMQLGRLAKGSYLPQVAKPSLHKKSGGSKERLGDDDGVVESQTTRDGVFELPYGRADDSKEKVEGDEGGDAKDGKGKEGKDDTIDDKAMAELKHMQLGLLLVGLSEQVYPCLNVAASRQVPGSEVSKMLIKCLRARPDPVKFHRSKEEKEALKDMMKLVYKADGDLRLAGR